MLKTLFRDTLIYSIPTVFTRGLSFLLIPLYSRLLTPSDYGTLDILLVCGNFINLTIALEVSQGVARYSSAEKDAHRRMLYASSAFWFTLVCYTIFFIITILFSDPLSIFLLKQSGLTLTLKISLIYISLNGISLLVNNQFRWELRSFDYTISSVLSSFFTIITSVILTYFLRLGVNGLLLGMIAGNIISLSYGLWLLKNSFSTYFSWKYLKQMLLFSVPLVPSSISIFISNYLDRFMINYYLSLEDVGLYSIAFRLSSIVSLSIIGFQNALTPIIYNNYLDPQTPHKLASIFRIFTAMSLIFFLVLSVFSKEIFYFLLPPSYHKASTLVILMVPSTLLSSMYIFVPGIDILKKTHFILFINLGGAILNIFFNYLLIPSIGTMGAAIATLVGYAVSFTVYMILSQKFYYVPHNFKQLLVSLLLIILLVIITMTINFKDIYFNLILKFIIVFIALVILTKTKLIKTSEIKIFLNSI